MLRSWSITISSKKTFILVVDVTQSDNVMVVDEFYHWWCLRLPLKSLCACLIPVRLMGRLGLPIFGRSFCWRGNKHLL